jgi:hypothetical protein
MSKVFRYCFNDTMYERFLLFNPGGELTAILFYYVNLTCNNFGMDSHFPDLLWSRVLADKRGPANYICTLHKPSLQISSFSCTQIYKVGKKLFFTFEQTVCVLNGFSMESFSERISALLYIHKTPSEHLAIFGGHVRTRLILLSRRYFQQR